MPDISKVNGVAFSSIGGINGVAKASIASLNGLSAPSSTVAPVVFYDAKNASSYGGSGTTWSDLKSGGYDMTLTNGPVFTSGTPDHFDFDGVNDIAVNNSNGPQIFGASSAYSFEAWVRLDGLLSTSSTTPIYSIASKSPDSNTVAGWKWTLRSGSYNGMMLRMGDSGGGFIDITPSSSGFLTAINDTTDFHQVIVTIDESAATVFVYADGTQYSTTVTAYTGGALGNSRNNTSDLCLARYSEVSSSFEFNGDISEVSIYDKALSQAEVTALYNAKAASFGIFTGLLDTYSSNASVAYSTRRLRRNTTNLMRVRREVSGTGNNDEADFQFDPATNDLTLNSPISNAGSSNADNLGEFLNVGTVNSVTYTNEDSLGGTAIGFVSKIYDQSGNDNTAIETTTSRQPKIHAGGANTDVNKTNGKAAFLFDGNQKMQSTNSVASSDTLTAYIVANLDETANSGYGRDIFGQFKGQTQPYDVWVLETFTTGKTLSAGYSNPGTWSYNSNAYTYTDDTQFLFMGIYRTGNVLHVKNGNSTSVSRSGTLYSTACPYLIGAWLHFTSPQDKFMGDVQEMVCWQALDQDDEGNRGAIETNINGHFQIYS